MDQDKMLKINFEKNLRTNCEETFLKRFRLIGNKEYRISEEQLKLTLGVSYAKSK